MPSPVPGSQRLHRLVEGRGELREFWSGGPRLRPDHAEVQARRSSLVFTFGFKLPSYSAKELPSEYLKAAAEVARRAEDAAKNGAEYAAIESFRASRESGWDGPSRREFTKRSLDLTGKPRIELTYVMEYGEPIKDAELTDVRRELAAYY